MISLLRWIIAPAAALLVAAAPAAEPLDTLAPERIRAHVEFLASDLLEGRETGTRGYEIAAAYVASEFRELGLKPAGDGGSWFVDVPLRRASHVSAPVASYLDGGRRTALRSGVDFALRPSLVNADRSIDAGLVFAGHGIVAPKLGIDDYAGLDVRGKIVVVLDGRRPGLPSDVGAHLESMKRQTAAARGAVGIIELEMADSPRRRSSALERLGRPFVGWVDAQGRTSRLAAIPAELALSPEWSERLFANAPRSLATVRSEGLRGGVKGFALPARIDIRAQSRWEPFTSQEVVGLLPGADPRLADEYLVLMAHLDHLGLVKDAAPGADRVKNGALDNATGVATMIEAARSFVASGKPPRRSLLFIANTGEELGLIGAEYLAAHPPVPADRIVGLVNLDMPLLLYDFTDVVAFGAEHSTLGPIVAEAVKPLGISVSPDPMPEQSLFVRSDHYMFVKQGVPAVFLMTGHANDGKAAWDKFLAGNYHSANDDLAQPIDWRAAARFAEINYRIARVMADSAHRPLWYADDFFGDSFAPAAAKAPRRP